MEDLVDLVLGLVWMFFFFSAIGYLDITMVVEILYTGLSHKDKMIKEVLDDSVYLLLGSVWSVWFSPAIYLSQPFQVRILSCKK